MAIHDYKAAGVDIEAGNEAVRRIKKKVESTFNANVLTPLGSFGALYDIKSLLSEYQHPVLVQSIDGVGTKMIVARLAQKFDTIGMDLVSATANDIVVLGAKPLTLLDYIANDQLNPTIVEQIVAGMCQACRDNHIALIGGETAEMPGTYVSGEHDLVGVITGIVEKEKVILGKDIQLGDIVLALPSSGLHTNGYSLARHLLFKVAQYKIDTYLPDLQATVGDALLTPHLNYTLPIQTLLTNEVRIKGMAHITGGGVIDNIPRILPVNCSMEIQRDRVPVPLIFELLRAIGDINDAEMYRTFNMGMGLIMIVAPEQAATVKTVLKVLPQFPVYEVGQVVQGKQTITLV